MLTKGIFTRRRSTSPTEVDPNPVVGLAISPFEENLGFLQRIFDDAGWKLFTAHTLREAKVELKRDPMAVVICERHLVDGNWKDVLSDLAPILNPPRLIVMSRIPDNELWTEILNMGGFDLLPAPLREVEVGFSVGSAWLDWIEEGRSNTCILNRDDRREKAFHYLEKSEGRPK
jgi:DNA-binding NtrC family response regulator